MPLNSPENITLIKIQISLKDVVLGFVGGAVAYLFDYTRAKRNGNKEFKFVFTSMLINMCLGAFVAYSVGSFISSDTTGRDAIVGFSGVTAYNIILLAESRFAQWIIDKLTKK